MHMVIRAIVHALTDKAALSEAQEVFEELCNSGIFDYYTTFETAESKVSGGNLPAVVRADSKAGRKLIEEGMNSTKSDFLRRIEVIKNAVNDFSAEELFEMEDDDFYSFSIKKYGGGLRYNAYNIGRYRGHPIWLYDSDGEGIHTPGHLKRALKDKDIWVVLADVHF